MRCFSCEPLLDGYLEGSLGPRRLLQVARHLRSCEECVGLLRELRITDALLTTARSRTRVAPDFTAAVVSAARTTSVQARRRVPVWTGLIAYLVLAWALAVFLALRAGARIALLGGLVAPQRGVTALAAAARALAPATPLAAAAVTGILLLDLFLLAALVFGYRRVRPLIALYLGRGARR